MALSCEDFYTYLCDGWDDAVGDSLKETFESTCFFIEKSVSFINDEMELADGCIKSARSILDGSTMPSMPSV